MPITERKTWPPSIFNSDAYITYLNTDAESKLGTSIDLLLTHFKDLHRVIRKSRVSDEDIERDYHGKEMTRMLSYTRALDQISDNIALIHTTIINAYGVICHRHDVIHESYLYDMGNLIEVRAKLDAPIPEGYRIQDAYSKIRIKMNFCMLNTLELIRALNEYTVGDASDRHALSITLLRVYHYIIRLDSFEVECSDEEIEQDEEDV